MSPGRIMPTASSRSGGAKGRGGARLDMVARQERPQLRQPLPRSKAASQRRRVALRHVEQRVGARRCGVCGVVEARPWAFRSARGSRGLDDRVRRAVGGGDGRTDQIRRFIVIMIGQPKLDRRPVRQPLDLALCGAKRRLLRLRIAGSVSRAQARRQDRRRAKPVERGEQGARHRAVAGRGRVVRRLHRRVKGDPGRVHRQLSSVAAFDTAGLARCCVSSAEAAAKLRSNRSSWAMPASAPKSAVSRA